MFYPGVFTFMTRSQTSEKNPRTVDIGWTKDFVRVWVKSTFVHTKFVTPSNIVKELTTFNICKELINIKEERWTDEYIENLP